MVNSSLSASDLQGKMAEINSRISLLDEYSIKDLLALSTKLKTYQAQVDKYVTEAGATDESKNRWSGFNNAISKIIVDLQFNDIIRQKLEHMTAIHNSIISELSQDKGKHLVILPGIFRLQIAQLEYINKEYVKAVGDVKEQLVNIWRDSVIANKIELNFLSTLNHASKFSETIGDATAKLNTLITTAVDDREFAQSEVEHIMNLYSMQSEREVFGKVFNIAIEEEEEEIELF